MATTSFAESFKYGARLFGLFLALVVVGGGSFGLGAALVEREVPGWGVPDNPDTAVLAGGLVLGVLGASILIIGHFAIIYKLIADGVTKGTADSGGEVVAGPVEAKQSEPTEQSGPEPTPEQHSKTAVESTESGSGSDAESTTRQSPTEPEQQAGPSPDGQPPMESTPGEQTGATRPEEPEQQEAADSGREQTAEEIVFGSTEPDEQSDESAEETDEEAERSATDVDTAGNPGSDPLADNFDEE